MLFMRNLLFMRLSLTHNFDEPKFPLLKTGNNEESGGGERARGEGEGGGGEINASMLNQISNDCGFVEQRVRIVKTRREKREKG